MPSISNIINDVLLGENSFCSLCFKNDRQILFHDKIKMFIDETQQEIALTDILQSVFSNEMHEYLTTFENICENCLNFIIGFRLYIHTCTNNAISLIRALDGLSDSMNFTKEENRKNKSLFVLINEDFTSKLIYDNKKLESTTMALKRYNLLSAPKIQDVNEKKLLKPKKDYTADVKTSDILLDPNDVLPRCKECLRTYPSLNNLKNHFLKVHAPINYQCTKCSKIYSSPELLDYHMSVDHCPFICSCCGKEFNHKSTFMQHEMSHRLQLVCPYCGRIYKSSITYKRHIKSNLCNQETRASPANAQYTCDYCKKKYTQKMSLRVHIQYVHGNYKAHECKWCGKKFWAQSRLKAHIVKHTKEKNFICSICQGKFVTKESLLYHTRLHTGEKPYRCSQCDCTFISSSRRAYHMKTYHLKAMVECEICKSKFTSRSYLDKHMKSHKDCQNKYNQVKRPVTENHQKKKCKKHKSPINENNEVQQSQKEKYFEKMPAEETQQFDTFILIDSKP